MAIIPESLKRKAKDITEELLPAKSRVRYDDEYAKFVNWLNSEHVQPSDVTDEVLLVYLSDLSKHNKPSTLWYVVLATLQAVVSGAGTCKYAREYKMRAADCFNLNLDEIPRNLNRDIEILYATQNRIKILTNSSLQHYSNLRYLYLGANFIKQIEPGAFSELSDLEVLDLTGNAVTSLPADLPMTLRKVYLADNLEMKSLPLSAAFNLNYLSLALCYLKQIPQMGTLPNLKELNLTGNPLTNVTPADLAPLCRLERLYLPKTLFKQQDPHTQCQCHRLLTWTSQRYINLSSFNCTPLEDPDTAACDMDLSEEMRVYKACMVAMPASVTRNLLLAVLAGALILAVLVLCCWWRKGRRKKNSVQDQKKSEKRAEKRVEKDTKAADTLIT